MTITVAVPFAHPERVPIFAEEHDEIDFRAEDERAERCTLSYAAMELSRHLSRSVVGATVAFAARPSGRPGGVTIELALDARGRPRGSFSLVPRPGGAAILGEDRVGVLYGAYELLRLQGWRWYSPGTAGESVPEPSPAPRLPGAPIEGRPSFELYRGFDSAYASQESAELLVWMARNRLNLASHRSLTSGLGRKLGMLYKNGGHIFEPILDPDRVTPSGRTLWEEHREWYGLPASGERVKEQALRTQFCVSQPDLLAYLSDELLRMVRGPWREADLVAVWGFDTWGSSCSCPRCRALGNDTDQMLFLLSALRRSIDEARARGEVSHEPRIAGCAYEGTSTLAGPSRPLPENLLAAGDCIIYYPIDRSYAFDFSDPASTSNRPYAAALASWLDRSPRIDLMIGEYYNVSKFEDLPLLFRARILHDLPDYHRRGARAITYMHLPHLCWAMRTQTQALYAELAWNAEADGRSWLEEYFAGWYGPAAAALRRVYDLVEEGWLFVAEWRAWHRSLLASLLTWDGSRPAAELVVDNALGSAARAAESGRRSSELLARALVGVERAQEDERERAAGLAAGGDRERARLVERRLGEDRRLLRYGLDTMELMTAVAAYHDALRLGRTDGIDASWTEIERLEREMDGYWVPVDYEYPGPGLSCRDALTRTQLRDLIGRCRSARRSGAMPAS